MSKCATSSIYLGDRPDLMEKLEVLTQKHGLNMSVVVKASLDACIDDIAKQSDKRKVRLNGKDVMLA